MLTYEQLENVYMNVKEIVISAVVGGIASAGFVLVTDVLGIFAKMAANEAFSTAVANKLAADPKFIEVILKRMPRYELATSAVMKAERHNAGGTDSKILAPVSGNACFLLGAQFEDLDTQGETAECLVVAESNNWVLKASLSRDDDHDASCRAACVKLTTLIPGGAP